MMQNGATRVWELWNGNTADPLMNSGNHVMLLGDFVPWLFRDVAGIREDRPGFEGLTLRPHFVFDQVQCSHDSPRGRISSSWNKGEDGTIEWRLDIPPGTPAFAELPANAVISSRADAAPPACVVECGSAEGELLRFPLPSGSSAFEIRIR